MKTRSDRGRGGGAGRPPRLGSPSELTSEARAGRQPPGRPTDPQKARTWRRRPRRRRLLPLASRRKFALNFRAGFAVGSTPGASSGRGPEQPVPWARAGQLPSSAAAARGHGRLSLQPAGRGQVRLHPRYARPPGGLGSPLTPAPGWLPLSGPQGARPGPSPCSARGSPTAARPREPGFLPQPACSGAGVDPGPGGLGSEAGAGCGWGRRRLRRSRRLGVSAAPARRTSPSGTCTGPSSERFLNWPPREPRGYPAFLEIPLGIPDR